MFKSIDSSSLAPLDINPSTLRKRCNLTMTGFKITRGSPKEKSEKSSRLGERLESLPSRAVQQRQLYLSVQKDPFVRKSILKH